MTVRCWDCGVAVNGYELARHRAECPVRLARLEREAEDRRRARQRRDARLRSDARSGWGP